MFIVSVSFAVRDEDSADALIHELQGTDRGIYHSEGLMAAVRVGCESRAATPSEVAEVVSETPEDVLKGT